MQKEEVKKFADRYLRELVENLNGLDRDKIADIVEMVFETYQAGRQIFIFGNGGSAATASHLAADLSKGTLGFKGDLPIKRFKVISLVDNIPLITAWANDTEYGNIFSEQLKNSVQKGDLVIGISASGNSANVLRALLAARNRGAKTVGLSGFEGGKMAALVEQCLITHSRHYGRVEDSHLALAHLIAYCLSEKLKKQATK